MVSDVVETTYERESDDVLDFLVFTRALAFTMNSWWGWRFQFKVTDNLEDLVKLEMAPA